MQFNSLIFIVFFCAGYGTLRAAERLEQQKEHAAGSQLCVLRRLEPTVLTVVDYHQFSRLVYRPQNGSQRRLAAAAYPRADYWQAFIDHYALKGVNYQDEPALPAFELPDESHVSSDERAAYTRTLINILKRRGLLDVSKTECC